MCVSREQTCGEVEDDGEVPDDAAPDPPRDLRLGAPPPGPRGLAGAFGGGSEPPKAYPDSVPVLRGWLMGC